ncbi:MAG TPA: NAD(P)H:quinone oxidoreductase [Armatimonadota bacterium]|nr:NAD(P)H:quinone oxidoreductase [Armatimonadota bacterium]
MNILIVFDSRYGNTHKLAEAVAEGARQVAEAEARLARPPASEPEAIIQQNERWQAAHARFMQVREVTLDDFRWADAVILGSPTRFGNMTASLKAVVDGWGPLWMEGTLVGKVGAAFTSSSTMHGANEITILTMWLPLIHQGMVIVGVPYAEERLISTTRGGTPYGASSVSGPMADQGPNEDELAIARTLGRRVAEVAGKLRS